MATFNAMGANPAPEGLGGLNTAPQNLAMDTFDHELNFDDSLL